MKPQSTQRNTLQTLKDITEKIIPFVPIYPESSLITWARSVRKFI